MERRRKKRMDAIDMLPYFRKRAMLKRQAERGETAGLYRTATNWLRQFIGKDSLPAEEVTTGFVTDFEVFLNGKGLKVNSVNTYLSNFRAMYNAVVDELGIKQEDNPFANLKIKPQATAKRALSHEVIEEIAGLDLSGKPKLKQAADLSLFSFMACGMAFVDIAHLKATNIRDGEIIYNRHKTGVEIRIGITRGMQILLDKYKRKGSPYLFPVLKEEHIPHEVYKSQLRSQNEALKEIGQMLSVPSVLTTYRFRHTWASEALNRNISIAIISQGLGHTSEKTTRFYLAKLNQKVMNEANELIINSVDNMLIRGRANLIL